jgi:DNA invertase Pin-like site-specific DNA recombinase
MKNKELLDLEVFAEEVKLQPKVAYYIRVSTTEQNIDRQVVKDEVMYIDKCSGSIKFKERKQAKKLLNDCVNKVINEVRISSIDRLGRNTIDIMQTIQRLTDLGVNVVSDKEGLRTLNADGSVNVVAKMLVGVLGTLAEFELNRIKERQKEGIVKAKLKGSFKGRKVGTKEDLDVFMNKEKVQTIIRHLRNGESIRRCALLSKASISLVQKVKKNI